MKAFIADAEWRPRKDYPISKEELRRRRALVGSQVWCEPRFALEDVPTPDIEEDEVLVRVVSCGICGSDTHLYETDEDGYIIFSGLTKLPSIIGHEFSGVVERIGAKVVDFEKGDRVSVESVMWCGMCQPCRSGAQNQCVNVELMGLSSDGAFAEHIAVNARYCWKIDSLSAVYSEEDVFDIGALIEPVGCAYNGMYVAAGGFRPGATVAVYGAGPIGLGAIALARFSGASVIIAFDPVDERVRISEEMGADHAFNVRQLGGMSPAEKVDELTNGWGADVQVEAAGAAPATIPEMEKAMSVNGKIIYLGRAATSTPVYLDALVSGANTIVGSRGHAGSGVFPFIIKSIASGRLDLKGMITTRYPFSRITEALENSTSRKDGKILIRVNE